MVLLALLLRLLVVLCVFRQVAAPTYDHNEFGWEMGWTARSIVLGRGFSSPFFPVTGPTALVPPLYVYLLAGVQKIFGLYSASSAFAILSLNSLFSALTSIPIYFAMREAVSRRFARMAALAWAVYPFSVYFAADRVWDYALTALLLSLCFWMAQRMHLRSAAGWLAFGALGGLATLSNPSVLSVLAVLTLIAMVKVRRTAGPWVLRGTCVVLMGAAVCSPWMIRNWRVFHRPIFLRDGFWLEFYAGNNGDTFQSNPAWAHPASNPMEMRRYESMSEPAYMEQKKELSTAFVEKHPLFFVGVSLRRALSFWTSFWSLNPKFLAQDPTLLPDLFFCSGVTVLVLRGVKRWWTWDPISALPYVLSIAVFPVAYYVTHSSPDYREPIEPIVVALAVAGMAGIGRIPDLPDGMEEEDPLTELEQDAVPA